MAWLIIGVVLVLIVAALLRDNEPAFPSNARRRNRLRGRVNVGRPANDGVPDLSVFSGSWHDASDCGTSGDSGSSDCSSSSD